MNAQENMIELNEKLEDQLARAELEIRMVQQEIKRIKGEYFYVRYWAEKLMDMKQYDLV